MVSVRYARAYVEVLECLKLLPYKEYAKIPNDVIDFFEQNKDNEYKFQIDTTKDLKQQNISREANSTILVLFRDYFATETEKENLKKVLQYNENIYQEELRNKYNIDINFNKRVENRSQEINTQNLPAKVNENIFARFLNKIKNIFHIK